MTEPTANTPPPDAPSTRGDSSHVTLAAYSLVRLRYKFRNWAGRLIMFSYLTPSSLLFIPLAVIVKGQPGVSEVTGGRVAAPIARAVMEVILAAQEADGSAGEGGDGG